LAGIPVNYLALLLVAMSISIYWIVKIFHGAMAFIVGGCIIWHFIREENTLFEPKKRLYFHIRCVMSVSFGSLCKAALVTGFSDFILSLHIWSEDLRPSTSWSRTIARCCNCQRLVAAIISPFLNFAYNNNRLGYCLTAIYGQTFSKAGEFYSSRHPRTIELCVQDMCHFNLTCIVVEVAGIISIFFGLFSYSESKGYYTEGTFLAIIYFLAYSGMSLCIEVYKSAVDALIVSFAIKPEKLANENQIIFLRFLRTADPSLR
jgi:hypothetical protein